MQQYQTSGAQKAMGCLNIFNSTLDACKDVDPVSTFQTIVLSWYNGALFGLTPFKADFFGYVECDIPVKNVTKANKVVGIVTTIHNFKIEN